MNNHEQYSPDTQELPFVHQLDPSLPVTEQLRAGRIFKEGIDDLLTWHARVVTNASYIKGDLIAGYTARATVPNAVDDREYWLITVQSADPQASRVAPPCRSIQFARMVVDPLNGLEIEQETRAYVLLDDVVREEYYPELMSVDLETLLGVGQGTTIPEYSENVDVAVDPKTVAQLLEFVATATPLP